MDKQQKKDQNPPMQFSWGIGNIKPVPTAKVQNTTSYSTGTTLPSKPNALIKDPDKKFESKIDEISFEAKDIMNDIKQSQGYKDKLQKAIEESNKIEEENYKNKNGLTFVKKGTSDDSSAETYFSGANKTSNPYILHNDIEDKRLSFLMANPQYMTEKDKEENPYTLGYMETFLPVLNPTEDKELRSLKYEFQKPKEIKIRYTDNDSNFLSTMVEELEHYSHYPNVGERNLFNDFAHNILPYEANIIKKYNTALQNYNDKYLSDNSETLAKKRATEVYLIKNKLLKPGEKVTGDHYNYLKENYFDLPNNVQQFIDLSLPTKEEESIYKKEDEKDYDEFLKKELLDDSDHEYIYKKRNTRRANNFLQLMNLLAKNNKNPYLNYG